MKVNYSTSAHIPDQITDVGDVIRVKHPKCNIDILTEVISVEWDVIGETYKTIEFGNFRKNTLSNLKDNISNDMNEKIESSKSFLNKALEKATAEIWGVLGNSYVIYEGDKILVVDKLPKEEAKNCMVITSGGIGFSTTGIKGPFNSAWTIDGTLDMQYINVLNLTASLINGGVLKLGKVDNSSGVLELYDERDGLISNLTKDGWTFWNGLGRIIMQLNKNGLYYSGEGMDDGFGLWGGAVHGATTPADRSSFVIFHAGGNNGNISGAKVRIYQNGDCYIEGLFGKSIITNDYMGYVKTILAIGDKSQNAVDYMQIKDAALQVTTASKLTCYIAIQSYSDTRLKKNIENTEINGLDVINKIRHIKFNWKEDGRFEELGYSANQLKDEVNSKFATSVEQAPRK